MSYILIAALFCVHCWPGYQCWSGRGRLCYSRWSKSNLRSPATTIETLAAILPRPRPVGMRPTMCINLGGKVLNALASKWRQSHTQRTR